jgi:hypothetical protein
MNVKNANSRIKLQEGLFRGYKSAKPEKCNLDFKCKALKEIYINI